MYNFHKTYIKACNSKIKGQLYELRGLQEAREQSGIWGSWDPTGIAEMGVMGMQGRGGQDQASKERAAGWRVSSSSHHLPCPNHATHTTLCGIPLFQAEPASFPPSRKLKKRGNLLQGTQTSRRVWSAMARSWGDTWCQMGLRQRYRLAPSPVPFPHHPIHCRGIPAEPVASLPHLTPPAPLQCRHPCPDLLLRASGAPVPQAAPYPPEPKHGAPPGTSVSSPVPPPSSCSRYSSLSSC